MVYSKSFPSHIDSPKPEGQVRHLSKCKLLYSKVLISIVPDLLLPCLHFSHTEVLSSLDAKSTLDKEGKSDALLTFPRTRLL